MHPAQDPPPHTRRRRPALVPEVLLHVADDVVALWEALERHRGSAPEEPPFWAAAWPGGQGLARYVLDHPGLVAGRPGLAAAPPARGGGGLRGPGRRRRRAASGDRLALGAGVTSVTPERWASDL